MNNNFMQYDNIKINTKPDQTNESYETFTTGHF